MCSFAAKQVLFQCGVDEIAPSHLLTSRLRLIESINQWCSNPPGRRIGLISIGYTRRLINHKSVGRTTNMGVSLATDCHPAMRPRPPSSSSPMQGCRTGTGEGISGSSMDGGQAPNDAHRVAAPSCSPRHQPRRGRRFHMGSRDLTLWLTQTCLQAAVHLK